MSAPLTLLLASLLQPAQAAPPHSASSGEDDVEGAVCASLRDLAGRWLPGARQGEVRVRRCAVDATAAPARVLLVVAGVGPDAEDAFGGEVGDWSRARRRLEARASQRVALWADAPPVALVSRLVAPAGRVFVGADGLQVVVTDDATPGLAPGLDATMRALAGGPVTRFSTRTWALHLRASRDVLASLQTVDDTVLTALVVAGFTDLDRLAAAAVADTPPPTSGSDAPQGVSAEAIAALRDRAALLLEAEAGARAEARSSAGPPDARRDSGPSTPSPAHEADPRPHTPEEP